MDGLFERLVAIADAGGDIGGGIGADEIFAEAGAADGAALVGPGAGADDRRVADAAGSLGEDAAGGSGGGEVAVLVERDSADRAHVRRFFLHRVFVDGAVIGFWIGDAG